MTVERWGARIESAGLASRLPVAAISRAVTIAPRAGIIAVRPTTSTAFMKEKRVLKNVRPMNQSRNADQKVPVTAARPVMSHEIPCPWVATAVD